MSESSSSSNSPDGGAPPAASQTGSSPGVVSAPASASYSGSNPSGSGPLQSGQNIALGRLDRISIGDVIADKYRIDQVLGKGGMGLVVAAEHIQLQERVAIKFLRLEGDTAPEFQTRFVREAQVSAKLRSEHVVKVRDFGMLDDGTPYMVMEYLEGVDLRKLLKQFGKLPVETALGYVAQACEGLAEAHAIGVVHRDMKPSNLYLTKRPDGSDLVKILDFGVAKMVQGTDHDELTAAGMLLGSPRYMSPEQLKGAKDIDGRADIWSLGAIMYELLVGRAPFLAQTTAALCMKILGNEAPVAMSSERSDITPELEAVIMQCLERNADDRVPDVGVLCTKLAHAAHSANLEAAAKRVVAVLERRAMQQTGTYSTLSSAESKGIATSGPATGSLSIDVRSASGVASAASWSSADGQSRKRTYAVAGIAGALVIGAGVLFAAFRGTTEPATGTAPPSATPPPVASPAPTEPATQQPTASAPPVTATATASEAAPSATAEPTPDKKRPPVYGGGPIVKGKTPPPPPTTATATATAPPTTTRPPVNPLEDRQ